jgi:hypothetical protein
MTNWDARHWMSNMGSMLATPTGSPLSNLFGVLLSDALFTILPGEYHRVKHYLLTQHNLSHDLIGSIKRALWRKNCKHSCGEPKTLVDRLYFVYIRPTEYDYVCRGAPDLCKGKATESRIDTV